MGECRQRNDSLSNNDTDEISVLCHKVNGVDAGEDIELHSGPEAARTGEVTDADTGGIGGWFHRFRALVSCRKRSDDDGDGDGEQDKVQKGKAISTLTQPPQDIILHVYLRSTDSLTRLVCFFL